MSFNFDDYKPQPNKWFSTKVSYRGTGIAEFSNPKGWIKGPTEIYFDETGKASVEMKVDDYFVEDRIDTEYADNDNFLWLLNGRKPNIDGNFVMHSGGSPDNECESLVVKAQKGIFRSFGNARYRIIDHLTDERSIFFDVSSSVFDRL